MSNKFTRTVGKIIISTMGHKVAYQCKFVFDKKAMIRELEKGVKQESYGKQLQKCSKVAIIFIGTNKYIDFFPKFYLTIRKYFLSNTPKDFFVFTDMVDDYFLKDKGDIKIVAVKHQNWPFTTLMRFKMINKIGEFLREYSHIIYIDADMYADYPVSEEKFFCHNKPFFGVQHDSYVNKQGEYEMDKKSTAAVSQNDDLSKYHVGAFWGGKTDYFLEMIRELEWRVDDDLSRNIIAKWHDESQMNKYFLERRHLVHTLDPSYSYPELKPIPKGYNKKFVHTLQSPTKENTIGRDEANDNLKAEVNG